MVRDIGFLNSSASVLQPRYFCAVYNFAGKADLGRGYWNPKRKLGVTTYFSEKITLYSEAPSLQKPGSGGLILRVCIQG